MRYDGDTSSPGSSADGPHAILKRVMRRYRLVILCSLVGALGFGACSLDPVPVLPGHDRQDPQPEIPPGSPPAGADPGLGIDLDGDGIIDGYDTDGDGIVDTADDSSGTTTTGGTAEPEAPVTDEPGDPNGMFGGGAEMPGEGGAAGDTGI